MYIWKTQQLVNDLRAGPLDEGELKNYYLVYAIIISVVSHTGTNVPLDESMFVLVFNVIGSIMITIIGINAAFKANGGSAGSRFIEKAVSISLPLTIKLTVGFVLFFVLFFFLLSENFELNESQIEWIFIVGSLVIEAVFMWRLTVHVRATNEG
jgi:hypothetical protein